MSLPRTPLAPDPSKLRTQLQELATVGQNVAQLTDQVTKYVNDIESGLNKLNVGMTAYVEVGSSADEDGVLWDSWNLRYQKEAGRWGFFIEHRYGNTDYPEKDESEQWPFKDSPREHRMRAVEKIPELLEELLKRSKYVASEIAGKVSYAKSLAGSFTQRDGEAPKQ